MVRAKQIEFFLEHNDVGKGLELFYSDVYPHLIRGADGAIAINNNINTQKIDEVYAQIDGYTNANRDFLFRLKALNQGQLQSVNLDLGGSNRMDLNEIVESLNDVAASLSNITDALQNQKVPTTRVTSNRVNRQNLPPDSEQI